MNEQERIEQMQKALGQEVANRIVQVEIRNVYGNNLVYPVNATAKKFASLLGVKSFNPAQIVGMKSLGYTVGQVIAEVVL